jgi:hypothetical protein
MSDHDERLVAILAKLESVRATLMPAALCSLACGFLAMRYQMPFAATRYFLKQAGLWAATGVVAKLYREKAIEYARAHSVHIPDPDYPDATALIPKNT